MTQQQMTRDLMQHFDSKIASAVMDILDTGKRSDLDRDEQLTVVLGVLCHATVKVALAAEINEASVQRYIIEFYHTLRTARGKAAS